MSSSVQLESGNTRTLSPGPVRALYRFHNSGRWFFGSQRWRAVRNEKTRSLARDFSSSRRAPPIAASKPPCSRACFRPWVFMMSVCTAAPWLIGPTSCATPSGLMCTRRSTPVSAARRSRKAIISRNFQRVSICSSGIGGRDGANALSSRCSSTELSLPTEYSITGARNSAATSRRMWMLSASSRSRWDSGGRVIGMSWVSAGRPADGRARRCSVCRPDDCAK